MRALRLALQGLGAVFVLLLLAVGGWIVWPAADESLLPSSPVDAPSLAKAGFPAA